MTQPTASETLREALSVVGQIMLWIVAVQFAIGVVALLLGMIVGGAAAMLGLFPADPSMPPALRQFLLGWMMLSAGLLISGLLLVTISEEPR